MIVRLVTEKTGNYAFPSGKEGSRRVWVAEGDRVDGRIPLGRHRRRRVAIRLMRRAALPS